MILKNVLSLCEQYGFLLKKPTLSKHFIAPAGTLLLENLKHEWLQSMVNYKDYSIYYSNNNFTDSYEYVKRTSLEKLPFGFATIREEENNNAIFTLGETINDKHHLNTWVFIPPTNSVHAFHQWQRQRRMWWRKFSATPGRYFTTDIIMEEGSQKIEICAKYPWGNELVEVLRLTENHPLLTSQQLQNLHERKKVSALTLSSEIHLGTMYLNTICDAYEILKLQDGERHLLKFHRKLAPYKVGFSLSHPQNGQLYEDLKDLTKYLCKKLRGNNVVSLMLPNFARATLETQFKNFDHLGVPYTIVLGENTLKNGILYLRSRDTTIKEQVHVTELPNYIGLLFRNY